MDGIVRHTPVGLYPPRQEKVRSRILSLLLVIVAFFGLCGAFMSNIFAIQKFHYVPLAAAIVLVVLCSIRLRFLPLYICAGLLAAASPFVASGLNEYLSYFSSIVLPIVWFCAGGLISISIIAHGFAVLSFLLMAGLGLEISGVFPDLFPFIGVKIGGEVAQRFGSFTLNPLALGYFAALGGALSYGLQNRAYSRLILGACVILLLLADSRGGGATFIAAILMLRLLKINKIEPKRNRVRAVAFFSVFLIVLGVAAISNERVRSAFDWSGDEGNLGRLNQWGYCFIQAAQNPLGVGPGAMTPIGIGDDPYIEDGIVKSCDSTLLKMAVEYGFGVASLYFLIITYLLYFAWKGTRRIVKSQGASNHYASSFVVASSIAGAIFLQQFMNQTLESIWIGAVFFSLLGSAFWKLRMCSGQRSVGFFGRVALVAGRTKRSGGSSIDQHQAVPHLCNP